ncbi:MAG: TAT-variant-translocated molybdopterin oxidoreductase, partial [Candidatus Acidiferrales bacterium]
MSSDPKPNYPASIDLDAARIRAAERGGKRFWQSVHELSDTEEFHDFLENEFPANAAKDGLDVNRRDVLKLMAASAAMTGLSACTKLPVEKIVPYVKPPEQIVAGKPLFYATSMTEAGIASGLVIESHMGRPTKVEGNSQHPGSLGGTNSFQQASILTLYDPDRSTTVTHEGRIETWDDFVSAAGNVRAQVSPRGAGLRILTGSVSSPTLGAQIKSLLAQFPDAKWHQYEPCTRDGQREGARMAFGKIVNTVYHIDQADVIVALDSDFLTAGPGQPRYAREFSSRRTAETPQANLNRLYAIESMPTGTGAVADHR